MLTVGLLLLCLSQAFIYLSAPFHSLLSLAGGGNRRAHEPDRANIAGNFASESRLGLQVGLVAITLFIFVFAAAMLPTSDRVPLWYSIFNPESLIVPNTDPLSLKPSHPKHSPKGPKKHNDAQILAVKTASTKEYEPTIK
jgi:hypothetical protein